jgi:hypothetical protein
MHFFVPATVSDTQAEVVWEATRTAAQARGRRVDPRRVYSVTYEHNGRVRQAKVGERDPSTFEPVLVILEADGYLICTTNHGVLRGQPVHVPRCEALEVEYFDS